MISESNYIDTIWVIYQEVGSSVAVWASVWNRMTSEAVITKDLTPYNITAWHVRESKRFLGHQCECSIPVHI